MIWKPCSSHTPAKGIWMVWHFGWRRWNKSLVARYQRKKPFQVLSLCSNFSYIIEAHHNRFSLVGLAADFEARFRLGLAWVSLASGVSIKYFLKLCRIIKEINVGTPLVYVAIAWDVLLGKGNAAVDKFKWISWTWTLIGVVVSNDSLLMHILAKTYLQQKRNTYLKKLKPFMVLSLGNLTLQPLMSYMQKEVSIFFSKMLW